MDDGQRAGGEAIAMALALLVLAMAILLITGH